MTADHRTVNSHVTGPQDEGSNVGITVDLRNRAEHRGRYDRAASLSKPRVRVEIKVTDVSAGEGGHDTAVNRAPAIRGDECERESLKEMAIVSKGGRNKY